MDSPFSNAFLFGIVTMESTEKPTRHPSLLTRVFVRITEVLLDCDDNFTGFLRVKYFFVTELIREHLQITHEMWMCAPEAFVSAQPMSTIKVNGADRSHVALLDV